MRWVASDAIFKASIDWLRLPFSAQATHDTLERHCGRQENWGIIRDCRDWKNSWWAAIGISRQRIKRQVDLGLCRWVQAGPHSPEAPPTVTPSPEGRDLEVLHYDRDGQLKSYRGSRLQSLRAQIRWQNETSALSKRLILSETPDRTRSSAESELELVLDPKSAFQADLGDAAAYAAGHAAGHAKRSAPQARSGSGSPGTRDQKDPPPPPNHQRAGGSEGGGGAASGLSDPDWQRIWETLPKRRAYWEAKARQAFEDLDMSVAELTGYHEWLRGKRRTESWSRSAPTPLAVAADYADVLERRRRKSKESNGSTKPKESEKPERDIRESWPAKGGQA